MNNADRQNELVQKELDPRPDVKIFYGNGSRREILLCTPDSCYWEELIQQYQVNVAVFKLYYYSRRQKEANYVFKQTANWYCTVTTELPAFAAGLAGDLPVDRVKYLAEKWKLLLRYTANKQPCIQWSVENVVNSETGFMTFKEVAQALGVEDNEEMEKLVQDQLAFSPYS